MNPGYVGTPIVVLNGVLAGNGVNGLEVTGSESTIQGLVIDHFSGFGIDVDGGVDDLIQNNYIGTAADGATGAGNGAGGILVTDGAVAVNIAGNLIFGSPGIDIFGNTTFGTVVIGNFIGTDVTGTQGLGNAGGGIDIDGAHDNTIGGVTAPSLGGGGGNLISGNGADGIDINGDTSLGNHVQGNYIGVDAAGMQSLANHGMASASSSATGARQQHHRRRQGRARRQRHPSGNGGNGGVCHRRRLRQPRPGQPHRHQRRRHRPA